MSCALEMTSKKVTPVIVDCDPGIDDAWAIISLLKSEEKCKIKVKGLTVVGGNTSYENGAQNVLLILKTFDRLDVPVFLGADTSLLSKRNFHTQAVLHHGKDGFGDVYEDKPSLDLVQKKHAVEALMETIEEVRIEFDLGD